MDNKTSIKVMLCEMVVKAEEVKTQAEIETLTSDIAYRIVKLFATPAVSESFCDKCGKTNEVVVNGKCYGCTCLEG